MYTVTTQYLLKNISWFLYHKRVRVGAPFIEFKENLKLKHAFLEICMCGKKYSEEGMITSLHEGPRGRTAPLSLSQSLGPQSRLPNTKTVVQSC